MKTATIILAAGKGTRMRSQLLKVLHPLGGKPMLWHSLREAQQAGSEKPTVVVGFQAEQVKEAFGDQILYALQEEQLGTGHAVMQARPQLEGQADLVLVMLGDMPLLQAETLSRLIEMQRTNPGPVSMLTVMADDPRGFGRIVRSPAGEVEAIVEEADCTLEQLLINELNISLYCFRADWLWENLARIPLSAKGEYYLTDMIAIAREQGLPVQAAAIADPQEALGINTRVHLAEAETILRRRINRAWMEAGVTMIDPAVTYIEAGVQIGPDTILHPNTYLQGDTAIGAGCEIGPGTVIRSSQVGDDCRIFSSVVEFARLEKHVEIGPYAHLRKGAHLGEGVHLGNFGEVKNSHLAAGVKMGHFSYIGDAEIGENVNIGAGTITCNYDGKNKHKTVIEKDVFIGSDTMLVAPLHIGEGARTGAGAVVTRNVEKGTVVVGVPAKKLKDVDHEGG
jgi:bifunctional UDP-N-acetylglucosamine pyrophosphorylase/glucosamine-1-phosphate N-acetyltransferase